jgi:mannose-6-phosphate isomerase-like protein (cupin superfamily)
LVPAGEGWFIVNVRDAEWWTSESFGSGCGFENERARFPDLGINLSVLQPDEPNCLYHSESQQEAFLVVSGTCRLLVDGVERSLQTWDFVNCPAGAPHVFVGTGERAMRDPDGRGPQAGRAVALSSVGARGALPGRCHGDNIGPGSSVCRVRGT